MVYERGSGLFSTTEAGVQVSLLSCIAQDLLTTVEWWKVPNCLVVVLLQGVLAGLETFTHSFILGCGIIKDWEVGLWFWGIEEFSRGREVAVNGGCAQA